MWLEKVKELLADKPVWQQVLAGLIVLAVAGVVGLVIRKLFGGRRKPAADGSVTAMDAGDSSTQLQGPVGSVGDIHSGPDRSVKAGQAATVVQAGGDARTLVVYAEPGATVIVAASPYDFMDGLPTAQKATTRERVAEASALMDREDYEAAIPVWSAIVVDDDDPGHRSAALLQRGNCHYELCQYGLAADSYTQAHQEAERAGDMEGIASALGSLANAYHSRPARSSEVRAENVRKAVELYGAALEVFRPDDHPVDYATTQNNLGAVYANLPSATAQEREKNLKAAIDCCETALEVRKKDKYPQAFCMTAANLGMALAKLHDPEALHWLQEAYALRQFLPDRGEVLVELIERLSNPGG